MEKDFPNNDILLKNSVDGDNLKEESSKFSFKYQKKKSNVKKKVKKEANYFYYFNKTYRKIQTNMKMIAVVMMRKNYKKSKFVVLKKRPNLMKTKKKSVAR